MSNISMHLANLNRTFGTPAFDAAFAALKNDRTMRAEEVAVVASSFVSKTAKSAPRRRSLERILARHENRLDSIGKDAVLSHRA